MRNRRIRAFAGVRADTGESMVFPAVRGRLSAALGRLDRLASGTDFLLGHNLIAFDLPHLRAANPGLRWLRLPASVPEAADRFSIAEPPSGKFAVQFPQLPSARPYCELSNW